MVTPIRPLRCSICGTHDDVAGSPDSRYRYCFVCTQHAAGAIYHLLTEDQRNGNPFLAMLALAQPISKLQDSIGVWDSPTNKERRKPIPPQITLWMRVYTEGRQATQMRSVLLPTEGIFNYESIKLPVDIQPN